MTRHYNSYMMRGDLNCDENSNSIHQTISSNPTAISSDQTDDPNCTSSADLIYWEKHNLIDEVSVSFKKDETISAVKSMKTDDQTSEWTTVMSAMKRLLPYRVLVRLLLFGIQKQRRKILKMTKMVSPTVRPPLV